MNNPWFQSNTVPASGTAYSKGSIPLVKARTVSITVRETFNASGTVDSVCYIYYSPDGSNWDTIAYTSFAITVSAGNTVQRTATINVPEHGFIRANVANEDATYTITNVTVWYTIQSYEHFGVIQRGDIRKDTGEEQEYALFYDRR